MRGARRRGVGVNNKKAVMKTSWGKPVHVIAFIRTLLIVLAAAVCTVAAEDLETLRKKAEAGDAIAQNNLGFMYDKGSVSYNAPTLSGATQVCAARVPDGFLQSLEQLS